MQKICTNLVAIACTCVCWNLHAVVSIDAAEENFQRAATMAQAGPIASASVSASASAAAASTVHEDATNSPRIIPPIVIRDTDQGLPQQPGPDHPFYTTGYVADATELHAIPLVVSFENQAVETILRRVVNQVAARTGAWQLKIRLSTENQHILAEKMNLVAEVSFGDFLGYMFDAISNMTGVQLYASVFDGSRVILISDRY